MAVSLMSVLEGMVETRIYHDDADDRTIVERVQDCDSIVRHAKRTEADFSRSTYLRSDMVRVATVPNVVLEHWMKKYGIDPANPDDNKKILKLLNDPDWKYLKTVPGQV